MDLEEELTSGSMFLFLSVVDYGTDERNNYGPGKMEKESDRGWG